MRWISLQEMKACQQNERMTKLLVHFRESMLVVDKSRVDMPQVTNVGAGLGTPWP